MRLRALKWAIAGLATAVPSLAAGPSSRLAFEANAVVASGFRPGAPVVVFGVGVAASDYYPRVARYDATLEADGTGSVRYAVAAGLSSHSVWFAADENSGEYVAGSPGGVMPATLPVTVARDANGQPTDALSFASGTVDLLVVKPGQGSWIDSASSQGPQDLNRGRRGPLVASVRALRNARKSGPAAEGLRPPDLVIAVDPDSLRWFAGNPAAPAN